MLSVVSTNRRIFLLSCFAVFAALVVVMNMASERMFDDPDTGWHIATGDYMREHGAFPVKNPWSFTSGDERVLNISPAWDIAFSHIFSYSGWHGVASANALIIALTFAVIFAHCYLRSGGIASMLTVIFALMAMQIHTRPMQVTGLMLAIWMLLLGQVVRRHCSLYWLALLPLSMIVWVYSHSGFTTGFFILGIFGLQALHQRDWSMFWPLFLAGCASLLVTLLHPDGIHVYDVFLRTASGVTTSFVTEFKPLNVSLGAMIQYFYLVLFVLLMLNRNTKALPAEKAIAWIWLLLGFNYIRHIAVFAVVSAPIVAQQIHAKLTANGNTHAITPFAMMLRDRFLSVALRMESVLLAGAVTVAFALWTLTPQAEPYRIEPVPENPYAFMEDAVAYIQKNHPGAHFINEYGLGGGLIFTARGTPAVFVDGRGEVAYPTTVMRAYKNFFLGVKGWESALDKYQIDGAVISRVDSPLYDRLYRRCGWKEVFSGKEISVLLYDKKAEKKCMPSDAK